MCSSDLRIVNVSSRASTGSGNAALISGFVIGKSALEAHAASPHWRQTYLERRTRRIAPLYWATSILPFSSTTVSALMSSSVASSPP